MESIPTFLGNAGIESRMSEIQQADGSFQRPCASRTEEIIDYISTFPRTVGIDSMIWKMI